jgi:hypothetical protein
MAINLTRSYMGLLAGTVVGLATNIEQALIAQGLASANASKANITPGNISYNGVQGTVVIPAGAGSVTITNSMIDANTKVVANIAQAAADGTLTSLPRIVAASGVAGAPGSVTIYGNANATGAVVVDWSIVSAPGLTIAN